MQVYLCKDGEVSGPFTTDQLHKMRQAKEIDTDMLYWCEGMKQWEKFHAQRDLAKISAVRSDDFFPFESAPPPPAPWEKKNVPLRIAALLAFLVCIAIFALAWRKHTSGAQAELARLHAVLSNAERIRSEIKSGASYTKEDWTKFGREAGIKDMDSAQTMIGAPNKIADEGYRWIFFDRMIHPVTGQQTDMSILFDKDRKIVRYSTYP